MPLTSTTMEMLRVHRHWYLLNILYHEKEEMHVSEFILIILYIHICLNQVFVLFITTLYKDRLLTSGLPHTRIRKL